MSRENVFIFSLPDEMVTYLLSFVDADTLLNCRLVCTAWRVLIDSYAFQEKASRENEFVNNGRGYYSFSDIDSSTIRKLDLPWFVFYAICKHDPFNKNLVKNHCGQDEYKHWDIKNHENWWSIEATPQGTSDLPNDLDFNGHTSCFVSTYRLCSKMQKITFKDYGLTDAIIKYLAPKISVSEWHSGRFDCGCKYVFRANLYDSSDLLLEEHNYHNFLPQWEANVWVKASHTFGAKSKLQKASYIIIYHSGVDTQFWAGHYGAKITCSVVKVLLPKRLKSTLC